MNIKNVITISLYIFKNWYIWWKKAITIIGYIKVYYKNGWGVVYNPAEYEYKIHGDYLTEIVSQLQPGDIILRGFDHYLDKWLIPGNFSHSGIYIGDNKVIHAIAKGVCEHHILDYIQCDRVCVLRPVSGQDKAIERVKKWVGVKYDFKFNTKDSSEFYCHEMIANAYIELHPQTFPVALFGFIIPCLPKKYLAETFTSNVNFERVLEIL